MEMLDLIDMLEQLASQSKKVPLTGRSIVNPDQLLELVDQMRLAVPRGIQEAKEVLDRREQVIDQALSGAKRIKAAAESEARIRLDESEFVRSAKRRGEEVIQEAESRGQHLMQRFQAELQNRRAGADEYAREVLTDIEQRVSEILKSIRSGLSAVSPKAEVASHANGGEPA